MIGQTFGRLTVIEKAKTLASRARWLCQCSCGKQHTTTGHRLRMGLTNSCGCLRNESLEAMRAQRNTAEARAEKAEGLLKRLYDAVDSCIDLRPELLAECRDHIAKTGKE